MKKLVAFIFLATVFYSATGQKNPNPMESYQRESLKNKKSETGPTIKEFGGLILGYQGGKNHFFEIGYGYGASAYDLIFVGMGPSAEVNLKDKVNGYKFGVWVNSILSFGLNTLVYHNYNKESLFYNKLSWGMRPEIGIGVSKINITYGYNLLVNNSKMTGVNKNMISIRCMIPVKHKR